MIYENSDLVAITASQMRMRKNPNKDQKEGKLKRATVKSHGHNNGQTSLLSPATAVHPQA